MPNNIIKLNRLRQKKVLESLLESLDVSHSMLIDSQLAEAIEKQNDVFAQDGIILEMQEDTLFAQVLSFQVRSMHKKDVGRLATLASSASAIILDLRLNGGGSGSADVELASLFLAPETPILQMRDRL